MPQVVARSWVPVSPDVAFAVSQTTGEVRLRWDPFIRRQHLIDAQAAGKGVRTDTRARLGPRMISEYTSYRPPMSAGIKMIEGPWFFDTFGGGWRFMPAEQAGRTGTQAVWKYTFTTRPPWLRRVGDPLGQLILGREIRSRINAFAKACLDPVILAAVSSAK